MAEQYDDPQFFKQYAQMTRSQAGLAGAGEWATEAPLLPPLKGVTMLDLGCGYGWHCEYAADHGAKAVLGIDPSEKMLAVANRDHARANITYQQAHMETLSFAPASFDFVFSSLALHYVEDYAGLVQKVASWLTPGGTFMFCVEHPVFTAEGHQQWRLNADGTIADFPVDHYFEEGARVADFLDTPVVKYHRTLTTYLQTLLAAGFTLQAVVEPTPPPEMMAIPGMKDELRRPMMLIVKATH